MSTIRRSTRIAGKKTTNGDVPEVVPVAKKPKIANTANETAIDGETKSKVLEIGDSIPDLILKDENDKDVSLKELTEKNEIVAIFAYPKASTPGCTRQACGYSKNYDSLSKYAKLYGLSSDLPKAQKSFVEKQHLKLDGLLSDPKKALIGPLGAKKHPSGIKRLHWIFVQGKLKISRVQISPEVSIEDGKKEILEIYKELHSGEKPEEKSEEKLEEKPEEEKPEVKDVKSEEEKPEAEEEKEAKEKPEEEEKEGEEGEEKK